MEENKKTKTADSEGSVFADITMPQNKDAEKSLLGSIIISHTAADKALEVLSADDFSTSAHRAIFTSMEALYNAGKTIDTVTLVDMLERKGQLDAAGGATYITELALFTPSAANVEHYIGIVESHSIRRKLITAGAQISKDAANSGDETGKILDEAERRIYNIAMRKSSDSMTPIGEVYANVYDEIGRLMQLGGKRTGIATGLIDLDEITSGLQRSDLVIVAGRPAMGKSAFAFGVAAHAAIREKATVAIFSFEMSKEQIVTRLISCEAGINMQQLRTGQLTPTEVLRIADHFNTVGESNILIDDTPMISVAEIRSKCRRIQAQQGLDIVVIDYLQLMMGDTSGKGEMSRVQELGKITRGLKILARELNITVILLSQLSRQPDMRKNDHTPVMSDLRDSGSIEQDADVIMMLYRPAAYPDMPEAAEGDNTSYIILAKHRNGETGKIKVSWVPEFAKYTNYSDQ